MKPGRETGPTDRENRGGMAPHAEPGEKLGTIEPEGNRFILARVPLIKNEQTGEMELVGESPPGYNPLRKASQLAGGTTSNALSDAIRKPEKDDKLEYLSTYLDIPGKDNGFDIEGLAVKGEKVFVGVRGPVLRGWAVVPNYLSIPATLPGFC